MRAINSLPFNAHTNAFFRNMSILKLENLHQLSLAVHMFKNADLCSFDTNSDFHNYKTRNRNNLVVPHYNLSATQRNWSYRAIKVWNSIPQSIKSCNSVIKFKFNLKNYYLNQY